MSANTLPAIFKTEANDSSRWDMANCFVAR